MRVAGTAVWALLAVQTYPPPFPRDGITNAFENERVVVWEGTFPKGRPTVMHEHRSDLVGVFLTEGRVRATALDGTIREGKPFGHGHVVFQPRGVIHIEESVVDGTRVVGIELKEHQNPARHAGTADLPRAFPLEGTTLRLENDRVAIWEVQWIPGRTVIPHVHDRDVVVVPLENGELTYSGPNRERQTDRLIFSKAVFKERGESQHAEASTTPLRAIVIELK